MIELNPREMKNLSRILSVMLCFVPLLNANAAGPVATTSGSNLTAYNPSNAYNNQWATMSNGRYDGNNASAKVDFGNCNAVILRCAQPKCANGGCSDISIASAIVAGCVQSNEKCKQYGDDLVAYMSAQLVASSNAKINEQNAAAANAAATAAAQQSQEQMQQMQYQMQQMQQQMAQQQAQSQQQLQEALAQQAAQSQAAIENMKTAATEAAKSNEAGISAYQQDAINRGISSDVLERQKITGQVMTELENAETSLKEVKVAMNTAFEYAKCDARGNNCSGPKRIKKWRELATEFLEPYDETIDKVYDALELAQLVGVDLSDIYMMLNNSCNRWGQYMCPQMPDSQIVYTDAANGQKAIPRVCKKDKNQKRTECRVYAYSLPSNERASALRTCDVLYPADGGQESDCQPCTLLKVLSSTDEVYEGWVNAENEAKENTTVVACASGALDSSKLFTRRTKNKNGAGLVDINILDIWLSQVEPDKKYSSSGTEPMKYCDPEGDKHVLEKSMLSKTAPVNGKSLCVKAPGTQSKEASDECSYINPIYAICNVHPYNAGLKPGETRSDDIDSLDCVDKAKEACIALSNSGDKYCDKITWARYTDTNKINCEVKLCAEGYGVIQGQYCATNPSCLRADKNDTVADDSCKTQWAEYDAYMLERYGETREVVGLKTTVISQQMYKQYEYLSATLRRLKTQLEKATLTASLQAAGAKSDDSSSGLLGGGSSKSSQYRDCSGKNKQGLLDCMRENYSTLATQIKTNKKCDKNAKEQLKSAVTKLNGVTSSNLTCKTDNVKACGECLDNYDTLMTKLDSIILNEESKRNGRYRD